MGLNGWIRERERKRQERLPDTSVGINEWIRERERKRQERHPPRSFIRADAADRDRRGERVNIDEFYAVDSRRQFSSEVDLGRRWTDGDGRRYIVAWLCDTGEVFAMCAPEMWEMEWPAAGWNEVAAQAVEQMDVLILGTISTPDELKARLDGWDRAMAAPGSLDWLLDRLAQ